MGISGADFDHDGDWDFYHSNLGDEHLPGEPRRYVRKHRRAVPGRSRAGTTRRDKILSSWGTVFCDFDNDLWEDLLVVNGFINGAILNLNDPNSVEPRLDEPGRPASSSASTRSLSGMADTGAGTRRRRVRCRRRRPDGLLL